jgi:hypothetical protein
MVERQSKLHREISTYEAKRAELVDGHRDQYVLIKGEDVIDFFDSEEAGLAAGYEKFVDEPFLVRKVQESTTPVLFTSLYLSP